MRLALPFLILPIVAGLSSCASLSSYQESRVLDAGKGRLTAIFNSQSSSLDDSLAIDVEDFQQLEFAGRLGLGHNADFGVKYTVIGGIQADGKYQFIGRDSGSLFVLAAGLKGGYAEYETDSNETFSPAVIDITLPIYLGLYPTPWLSLNLIPDATYRISDFDYTAPGGLLLGGAANMRVGKRFGAIAEVGYHRLLEDSEFEQIHYGAGIYLPVDFEDITSMF